MQHTKKSVTEHLQTLFHKLNQVMGKGGKEIEPVTQEINQFIESLDIDLQEHADIEFKNYSENLLASLKNKLEKIEPNEITKNLSEKLTELGDVIQQI